MVAAVGDAYGLQLIEALRADRVATDHVVQKTGVASGIGMVSVVPDGENSIVVASGANATLAAADVAAAAGAIRAADAVLLQGETTPDANHTAARIAAEAGIRVALNAAPAHPDGLDGLEGIDLLVVNRQEGALLAACSETEAPAAMAARLLSLGVDGVVVTLGTGGALYADADDVLTVPAFPVEAVDTTACGDAFVGGYLVALCEGADPDHALRFASAAGALAATRMGAFPSLPGRVAVEELLQDAAR
jgi:ribokinase